MYKITILAAGLLALNCQSQKTVPNRSQQPSPKTASSGATQAKGSTISLAEGQNIFLKNEQMNLTFIRVVQDSRCPEGTNCIWAGAGTVEIEIMGTYTRPRKIQLSTVSDAKKGLSQTESFNGYALTLISLTPAPSAKTDKKSDNYKVTLKIEKAVATTDKAATK